MTPHDRGLFTGSLDAFLSGDPWGLALPYQVTCLFGRQCRGSSVLIFLTGAVSPAPSAGFGIVCSAR